MKKFLTISIPFLVFISCCFLFSDSIFMFAFGGSTLIKKCYSSYNTFYYYADWQSYLSNINVAFSNFTNSFTRFGELTLNWDGLINCCKSICNLLIAGINIILLPFNLFSCICPLFFALFGMPLNSQNFFYTAFSIGINLNIPYITY